MALSHEDKLEVANIVASLAISHSYCILAIVAALAEKGLLVQENIATWADVFAQGFDVEKSTAIAPQIAENIRGFAATMRALSQRPAGSGLA
jgi:hypothetical protein